jgi:uncharacterized membrane protein
MMVPMFQYGLLGAFLQVLCLIMNIILLYFLSHNKVLLHYFIFFISNMVFTYAITFFDFRYQGLGYLMSTFLVFVLSFQALNHKLKLINFYTFMGQAISEE